ncbi:hypothetical protein niasHT_037426 [Heterodera trifolii]|uniref:Uncharacterized protein n=1 Tax=Heterodera trifolii TaxID=157864 RepID=A0ABD2J4X0_9BILA
MKASKCVWREGALKSECCDADYVLLTPTEKYNDRALTRFVYTTSYGDPNFWFVRPLPEMTSKPLEERLYRKFTWHKRNTKDLIDEFDKKKETECKNKEVYCFCEPLHYDQIINGICCDNNARCDCCKTVS